MIREEIFELMRKNPVFFLATVEEDQPRVRGMLLYKADDNGIVFHTGIMKDVYGQVVKNPKVELCFNGNGTQVRVSGELEIVDDNNLKDEISEHPTRKFLKPWKESGELKDFYETFVVFRLKNGIATTWTIEKNFEPKELIQL
ncbi:pyridoxamine 5'-phosphate oxidase family protein [Clostridium sp. DJ247]|uniref:pyridoxamine 5'-phosphate oxidase family protein n=1 Tax=Clostridium sp. DJ247 TaxID=2726188 RepID=UPI001626464C|nr:pyridoxamine 5'-phosphate oxidase family protein [Clostridium sp. DJ247]MBC2581671.1 pyridoxamine 5'-phosphate oxidase family protein [Clostridium sp. DJ247]